MSAIAISHVEWQCTDLPTTQRFLQDLFGWQFQAHGRRYVEAVPEAGPRICLLAVADRAVQPSCLAYIQVSDLASWLGRAQAAGGSIALASVEIPGYGRYGRIQAPDGTLFGLFEAARTFHP